MTLSHNQGIKIDGLFVGGTYSVSEQAPAIYQISYSCDDNNAGGCSTENDYSGTIVSTGQTIAINNLATQVLSGKRTNNYVYYAIAGGCIAILGIAIFMRVRR